MKILMAYDGSEHSMHALNQGASLANITDSVNNIVRDSQDHYASPSRRGNWCISYVHGAYL